MPDKKPKDPINVKIGEIIKDLLEIRGIKPHQLAKSLQVKSKGHMYRILSGDLGLSKRLEPQVEELLNLPPGFFMNLRRKLSKEELARITKYMDMIYDPNSYPQSEQIFRLIDTTPKKEIPPKSNEK